eukprot:4142026-Heterocapsa_arctica.AAC.1
MLAHEDMVAQDHSPTIGSRGPAVRRPVLKEAFRIGRSLFKKTFHLTKLRDENNEWVTDPAGIDATLWRSREAIWTSIPPAPGTGKA